MRRWRAALVSAFVAGAVVAVVVAALLADGRVGSQSSTNDGGAWLLNRSQSAIGHVNRVVGEIESTVAPFSGAFEVSQSDGVVVVADRGASQAVLVDANLAQPGAPVGIAAGTEVFAAPGRVVLADAETGRVWTFPVEEFGTVQNVDGIDPQLQASPGALTAVGRDGTIAVADAAAATLHVVDAGGVPHSYTATDWGAAAVSGVTIVGSHPVVLLDDGRLATERAGELVSIAITNPIVRLQQPSLTGDSVVGVTADGRVVEVGLDDGIESVTAELEGSEPVAPIVHGGCVWAVTIAPSPVFHYCGRAFPLPTAALDVELTLVNGWVWVNDVDQGGIWFVREEELEVEEITDWTAALHLTDAEEIVEESAGGEEEEVENPEADDLAEEVDALDDDDRNTPPEAFDDEADARRGQATVVDVLLNDVDEDHDPLAVESLTGIDAEGFSAEGALVTITADGRAVQVQPPEDFTGDISFGYVVHDGRQGRDEAAVRLAMHAPDEATNAPPLTKDDNATVRAGERVSLNALTNDRDPDGDALVLLRVEGPLGSINDAPDGEVTFVPDVTSAAGTVELPYAVADSYGAESTGVIRVRVRPADSNQRPEARNDVGRSSVDRPVIVDVLGNDVDPDGDPLIAQNLQSVDGAATTAQLTPDGRFLFRPEAAGTFRFTYAVSDGPLIDQAQIRVDVDAVETNRPPVAIVDEIALAVGETRLVRVLDNDGDPDGDVVGIVDWLGADGLEISEVPGVGFNVAATPAAEPTTTFRYWISDGVAPPVRGNVVVSALDRDPVDYPPIAVNDVVDVRAGQTAQLHLLRNDHDPEGRVLTLVGPLPELAEGLLRLSPDRQSMLLTTNPAQSFSFQFAYDVADPGGNRGSAVVNVRIVDAALPNRAPVAGPDVARTAADAPVDVAVLTNDFDPDGDPVAVESIAEQPRNGTVEIAEDGTIRYTPNRGFSGTDAFVYTLVDGYQAPAGAAPGAAGAARSLGEVFVGVMPAAAANRPPTAVDDGGFPTVRIGSDPVVLDVLANDSDPDADPLRVTAVTPAPVGQVSVTGRGLGVEYEPPATGEPGIVSFSYSIADGRGGTASAQVVVELAPEPDPIPPEAVDDTVGPVRAGREVVFDPRQNDLDPDGSPRTLTVLPDDPSMTVLPDGRVRLVAPATTGELAYRVRDDQGLVSPPAFVTVVVTENQAPTIAPLRAETPFATPVTLDLHSVVTDPDGDPLVITLGTKRSGGSVNVVGAPADDFLQVQFTPDSEFSGPATFDFKVDDRFGHVVAGTAVVDVLPPENRPPVAEPISIQAQAGIPAIVRLPDAVTDPDPNGEAGHSFTIGAASGGHVTLEGPSAGGEVVVRSRVTGGGVTDSFTYTVVDGDYTATNTVTVELVVPDFEPPSLAADSARTLQGAATAPIDLLANDVDNSPAELRGDGLLITSVGVTPAGQVSLQGSGVVFTPNPDFFGTATFDYTVQDGRRSVDKQSTGLVTVEVVGRPDKPQPPTIDTVGNRYLIVGWRPPQGAASRAPVAGYVLSFAASDGTSGSVTFDTPATSYRWDGLTNAVQYCFRVAAVNEAGQGEFSDSPGTAECGVPDVRPEAPATPSVQFGNGQLIVSWSPPLNQGSPVKNYQLRISGGASDISAALGVTTSHTWTGLNNGTDYTFEVRAQNSALENDGWSEWSPLSSPEHPLTAPDAPSAPQAVRGDRQVVVTWSAPYDGGDRISRYQVRSSLGSNWIDVTPQGSTNSMTWEDIPNGTNVSFQVRAVNRDPGSANPGNISAASPVVRTCSVPDAPPQPSVTRGDGQVTVAWSRPGDQGCAISEYRVTGSPGGVQTAPAGATSHVFTGLANGTAYTFTVTAINEVVTVDGRAPNASPPSAGVTPAGPPFATNVTEAVNVGVRTVRVSWNAANPNGSPITSYQISVNDGAWADVGNVTSVTRTEGSNGATYTYRVRAVNNVGPSPHVGAAGSVTTWDTPGAPNVNASGGDQRINASWSQPASNGGTGFTGHQSKLLTGGDCQGGGTVHNNPGSPDAWGGLEHDTAYRVCVRYENAVGWGNWGTATARTNPAPRQVTASWGGSAQGQLGCSTSGCKYLNARGTGFNPGQSYQAYCQGNHTGSWQTFSNTYTLTANGSGVVTLGNLCYYGFTGTQARVVIGGVTSNAITN